MRYRIYRLKEAQRESYRWAPHTGGIAIVKTRDYEIGGHVEAATPYSAWKKLLDAGTPLAAGDLLEADDGENTPCQLQIAKYIGFEPAQWYMPEPKLETGISNKEIVNSHSGSPSGSF